MSEKSVAQLSDRQIEIMEQPPEIAKSIYEAS